MIFKKLDLDGVYLISAEPRQDERGFFSRIFCSQEFTINGIDFTVVQSNVSFSEKKGTLRGLHFQEEPFAEGKVICCLSGKLYDVFLDLRPGSKTYKQWRSVTLDSSRLEMLYIPKGFAHGFQTLEDNTKILYFMSENYHPECAKGVRWNDPAFNVQWMLEDMVISEKDQNFPLWNG